MLSIFFKAKGLNPIVMKYTSILNKE